MQKTKKKSNARKTSKTPTRRWCYGALAPSQGSEIVQTQLWEGHLLRQGYTDIENEKREAFRALRQEKCPAYGRLSRAYTRMEGIYADLRSKLPKKKLRTSEQTGAMERVTEAMKKVSDRMKSAHEAFEKEYLEASRLEFAERKKRRVLGLVAESNETIRQLLDAEKIDEAEELRKEFRLKPAPWALRRINAEVFEAMAAEGDNVWVQAETIARDAKAKTEALAKASICYSGTKAVVAEAFDRSRKTTHKPFIKRPSFDGRGSVGLQLQKASWVANNTVMGLPITMALSCQDPRLKVMTHEDIHIRGDKRRRPEGERPFRRAATAIIRLAGRTKDSPAQYIHVPFIMHRPFPPDALIKWVYLTVKRVGLRLTYELQFVIESETFRKPVRHQRGRIAVNLGWRVLEGGEPLRTPFGPYTTETGDILVATTWDGKAQQSVILTNKLLQGRVQHYRRLLSYSDEYFDQARQVVVDWLGLSTANKLDLNEALRDRAERIGRRAPNLDSINRWRGHKKLAQVALALRGHTLDPARVRDLWSRWKSQRLRGTKRRRNRELTQAQREDLFDTFDNLVAWFREQGEEDPTTLLALYLEWWRRKDAHLITYARDTERKVARFRQDHYRRCAALWEQQYRTVVVEKWDKSQTARLPEPEKDTRTKQEEHANAVRQTCGVSFLVEALHNAFGKDRVQQEKPNEITRVHYQCGGHADDAVPYRYTRCTSCESLFDQDLNAAKHLYDRGERLGDDEAAANDVDPLAAE